MSNDIRNLLNIKDPNIIFEENCVKREQNALYIHCSLTYSMDECPNCGDKQSIVRNGTRQSKITYLESSGAACYLLMNKQRYRCKACRHCFTAKTNLVEDHCSIALPVKQRVASLATDTLSEKKIAELNHVSSHTVRRAVDTFASEIRQTPTTLPTYLCFDEFKSTKSSKGAMSFIFCDALTHQVVDVIEDRQLKSLKAYFYRFSLAERRKVKAIVIDMFPPYITLIRQLFPNAVIVMDHFHLVQALNRELNRCRVKLMNSVKYRDSKLYRKLKRYWKLLLMDPKELTYTTYDRFPLFDYLTNTGNIVDYLLDQDETLKATYHLVHQLRDDLNMRGYEAFERHIYTSTNQPVFHGLKRVIRSFKKYQDEIKATCSYPQLTNGPIEGINNKIKVLKRVAYGYRNYSHFRNRILLISRLYVSGRDKKGTTQQSAA